MLGMIPYLGLVSTSPFAIVPTAQTTPIVVSAGACSIGADATSLPPPGEVSAETARPIPDAAKSAELPMNSRLFIAFHPSDFHACNAKQRNFGFALLYILSTS